VSQAKETKHFPISFAQQGSRYRNPTMMSKRTRRRVRKNINNAKSSQLSNLRRVTALQSTYRMPVMSEWMRGDTLTLTVAAGASVFTTPTFVMFDSYSKLVTNAATILALRQDYRFTSIRATITPLSDNVGRTAFCFSEDTALPAVDMAANTNCLFIQNTNKARPKTITWNATSIIDLNFTSTSAGTIDPVPVQFLAYTSSTYGTATNGTGVPINYFQVEFYILVEYRGLGN